MPLEEVDFIEDFVETNPVGSTDPKSEGDDHLRNIKRGILANLPNLGREAVRMSASQFNAMTGMIGMFPVDIASGIASGWLECNGQALIKAEYPDLFAVIGEAYGDGDASGDQFQAPDYRGYFLRAIDDDAGRDPDAAARVARPDGVSGDNPGTTQGSANLSHNHTATQGAHSHTLQSVANGNNNPGGTNMICSTGANTTHTTSAVAPAITVAANGGDQSRPINISVRYYIHV